MSCVVEITGLVRKVRWGGQQRHEGDQIRFCVKALKAYGILVNRKS